MTDKTQILALMDAAEAVYLATISEKGPRIRALVNLRRADLYPGPSKFARTEDFTVYFVTTRDSDKMHEIAADPRVSVYFNEPEKFHGVTLSGRAEIVDDPALQEAFWSEDWRVYWPDGPSMPGRVVVRVRPDEIRGWWGSKPFTLEAS